MNNGLISQLEAKVMIKSVDFYLAAIHGRPPKSKAVREHKQMIESLYTLRKWRDNYNSYV